MDFVSVRKIKGVTVGSASPWHCQGVSDVGPLPVRIGNNRAHIEGWMLVSYYLPGNSLAPPQCPRANGIPAQGAAEQAI